MAENFIHSFISLLDGTEVPPLFSFWTAIAGVSSLLGRRVWFDFGIENLYPNVCIVLAAKSGDRKSTPIILYQRAANLLPPELKPNFVPDSVTAPLLVQAMNSKGRKQPLADYCEGFGLFSELKNFLGKTEYDGALPALLIDLIDCHTHDKGTIIRGIEKVTNPCFGFIGATTIEGIRAAIPEGAIGDGLASRFIFVHNEGRKSDRYIVFPDKINLTSLLPSMTRLATLQGQVDLSDEVYFAHTKEYIRFKEKSPFWSNGNLVGYAQRRDKHLLKLAMIFAIASGSMTIYLGHYEAALGLLYKSEIIMPKVIQKITSSSEGSKGDLIIDLVSRQPIISRTDLLKEVVHMMNSRELGEIIGSLLDSEQIRRTQNGRDWYYEVIKNGKEK